MSDEGRRQVEDLFAKCFPNPKSALALIVGDRGAKVSDPTSGSLQIEMEGSNLVGSNIPDIGSPLALGSETINFTVTVEIGKPTPTKRAPKATVYLFPPKDGNLYDSIQMIPHIQIKEADSEGVCTFTNVPPGTYHLMAIADIGSSSSDAERMDVLGLLQSYLKLPGEAMYSLTSNRASFVLKSGFTPEGGKDKPIQIFDHTK